MAVPGLVPVPGLEQVPDLVLVWVARVPELALGLVPGRVPELAPGLPRHRRPK